MFITINFIALKAGNDIDQYFSLAKIIAVPLAALMFVPVWLLNTGKLVFVKAFRILAIAVAIAYVCSILTDAAELLLNVGNEKFVPVFQGAMLVLFSPLLYLMGRDFQRCRWLDPNSRPDEWEIGAIRDPNSINYRAPR